VRARRPYDLRFVTEALASLAPPQCGWAAVPVADRAGDLLEAEQALVQRFAPRRLRAFASGRRAARLALEAAGCTHSEAIGVRPDGAPIAPSGWLVTISHSDEIAVALASPATAARAVGIDVEPIDGVGPELRRHILGQGDRLPQTAGPTELAATFSLKESLFKAFGQIDRTTARDAVLSWTDDLGGPSVEARAYPDLIYGWRRAGGHIVSLCLVERSSPPIGQ
jgi:4'-phosphopantetheinyl transferase EntD